MRTAPVVQLALLALQQVVLGKAERSGVDRDLERQHVREDCVALAGEVVSVSADGSPPTCEAAVSRSSSEFRRRGG